MSIRTTTEDFLFRTYRVLGRKLLAHSKNPRASSLPFVTGDGFRELADHIFDDLAVTLNPADIQVGDTVFVGDSLIQKFLETIHPHIVGTYTLITHNGDAVVDQTVFERARDKVTTWYGINVIYSHPQIIPIPLGIENKHHFVCGIPAIFHWIRKQHTPKSNKIFYGFTISTNPTERQAAFDVISKHSAAETLTVWRNFLTYIIQLAKYKFVLSPPGSSTEGHRTWDTLYIGGVPIVKSSVTTEYFKSIGVPLLVVHEWNEMNDLTEETIESTYKEIMHQGNHQTLYFDYWKNLILNHD